MSETDLDLCRALAQRLESLSLAGVTHVRRETVAAAAAQPVSQPVPAPMAVATPMHSPAASVSATTSHSPQEAAMPRAKTNSTATPSTAARPARDTLEIIRGEVAACTRCAELVGNRTQTVFGVGNPHARLVFCGEAPGADEDRRGEPFVGAAGQLLNKILAACGLAREEVYILNICKCRPPANRTPVAEEATNCRPFLERQLGLIRPEFICCLGACAAQNLLQTMTPIGKMRQRTYEAYGAHVVCTYHPAYLLRNPPAKKDTWDDMKFLLKLMNLPIPSATG